MRRSRNEKRKISRINYGQGQEHLETKKRKNKWVILFVILLLLLALGGGAYAYWTYMNQEPELESIELGDATLPRIISWESGYEVNELLPYTTEMDILTMRDTISPLTPQGNLDLEILDYGQEITRFSYVVMSLDGSKILKEEILTEWDDNQITLGLNNVVTSTEESLLKIVLTLSDGTQVYYYTRIMAYNSCYMEQNLNFIAQMQEDIFAKNTESLSVYFSEDTTSSSFQVLTMASGLEQITWGDLSPEIVGDVKWSITECTSLFMSVQLEYQVRIPSETDESVMEYYNVVESYRVGYSTSNAVVELKQYNRTMNQILQADQDIFGEDGILLGIVDEELITYKWNDEETDIAFVQERALYIYHEESNALVQIFSYEEINEEDSRYCNDEYDIQILAVDENGSVNFVVYGYVNRGTNEGKVGASIYYYDALNQTLIEKAFISTTQSFSVGQEEMSQGMYYSNTQNVIYIIAQDAFYKINLIDNSQETLTEDMGVSKYEISDDGMMIAYAIDGNDSSEKCVVMNFETGETYSIFTSNNELVMPLGFIDHDVIYGVYEESATLLDEGGEEITPMYKIEVMSEEGELLITYQEENVFIRDIAISDNMITMNLVQVAEEQYVYSGQDVITNNVEKSTELTTLSTYSTELQLQQVLLQIDWLDEEDMNEVEYVAANLILNSEGIQISYDVEINESTYYAYAYGQLQVISTMASDAIQYASENVGAVVNDNQEYVWRSGNRDLTYTVSNYSAISSRMSAGESAIEIVSAWANQNPVSYTGCTTEQMCYIINQGQVIAAKLEGDSWIMLIGYTGSTMYYLNENGVKQSISMSSLDNQVIELIGDGIY